MSALSEIEYLVSRWVRDCIPHHYNAENKSDAWEDDLENFIEDIALEIEGDLEPMIDTWLDNHFECRIETWVDSLSENEEEDNDD